MIKVYITQEIPSIAKEILSQHFEVTENHDKPLTIEQLQTVVKQYDGVLSMFNDPLSDEVINCAEQLKVISNYAIGTDNIDLPLCHEKKIKVYNLPDVVTNSTAELTFALLLTFARQIIPAHNFVQQGKWKRFDPKAFCGQELYGKTIGILGYGRIGKAVAKRAGAFGMKIKIYNRSRVTIIPELSGCAEQVTFETAVSQADYVSIHLPLVNDTKGLVDLAVLKKMKKTAILLNLGRGPVVNTDDLLLALSTGLIQGAALDVVDPEPLGVHRLLELDNCLIVPHIGTATVECRHQMAKQAAENIVNFFVKHPRGA